MFCPKCGKEIPENQAFCASCGAPLTQAATPGAPAPVAANTSGMGSSAQIPPEIRGWNWGAFFLHWIWGIGNSVWIALLCLIPFVNLVMMFVLGAKGSEWAWAARKWDSVEHFKRNQKNWALAGLIVFLVGVVVWVIYIVIAIAAAVSTSNA